MKKILAIALFSAVACAARATTWYATTGSGNMSTRNWVPTSTGSCTGSGTALVWGAQANGDVFDANGCTAIAVDQDPGGSSVEVTLQGTTHGGTFTYATATNVAIHANVVSGTSVLLTISGSTGGLTLTGNVTGGSGSSDYGISDGHTSITLYVIGNITAGSGGGAHGYNIGAAATTNLTGNAIASAAASGVLIGSGGTLVIAGNCVGSDTSSGPTSEAGCNSIANSPIYITGSIIYGKRWSGAQGEIYFTPGATNYVLFPADTSYTLGTINAHATEMPTDPGAGNVLSGVNYGSYTGTYSGGGNSVSALSSW